MDWANIRRVFFQGFGLVEPGSPSWIIFYRFDLAVIEPNLPRVNVGTTAYKNGCEDSSVC